MVEFDSTLLAAARFMTYGGLLGSMGAVPGLSILFGPLDAMSIVLLAEIGAFQQLLRTAVRQSEKRVVAPLALAFVLTTPLGAWLLINIDPAGMRQAIAVTILGFVFILLTGWRY